MCAVVQGFAPSSRYLVLLLLVALSCGIALLPGLLRINPDIDTGAERTTGVEAGFVTPACRIVHCMVGVFGV